LSGTGSALSLDDLFTDAADDEAAPAKGSLRKKIAKLSGREAIPAPLGKVAATKLKREAGYEAAAADVSRWTSAVRKNREAEQLVLVADKSGGANRLVSMGGIAGNSHVVPNAMEGRVQALLKSAGIDMGGASKQSEGLELNKVTVEEVQERQQELAKMRSLMFAHEIKVKRKSKIKSRKFHQILKKEKGKKDEKFLKDLESSDPAAAREYKMQREREYAEERMTLKHKNTSKWAKHALRRGTKADAGTKSAIQDQLRKGEELRRKMELGDDDSSSEDVEDEQEEPGLWNEAAEKPKGIFALDFMKRGTEKRKAEAEAESDDEEEEPHGKVSFGGAVKSSAGAAAADEADDGADAQRFQRKGKTLEFGPRSVKGHQSGDSMFAEVPFQTVYTSDVNKNDVDAQNERNAQAEASDENENNDDDDDAVSGEEDNGDDDEQKTQHFKRPKNADGNSRDFEPDNDGPNPWLAAGVSGKVTKHAKTGNLQLVADDLLVMKQRDDALQPEVQQALIRTAFATDNEADFVEEKEEMEHELDPKSKGGKQGGEQDDLAGWGHWVGDGADEWTAAPKKEPAANKRKRVGPDTSRRDSKLKNVIISEKRDKKAALFLSKQVPFEFKTAAQYERAMRTPLGPDWNTDRSFGQLVKKEVVTRKGSIIKPMAKNLKAPVSKKRKSKSS